ncbi:MAG: hypothetical protein HRT35_22630 [Algicola sp.]|nr:hypothetical protein [Algicola sp.]
MGSISVTNTLMHYQRPAQLMPKQNKFRALQTQNTNHCLLAIDESHTLNAFVGQSGQQSQWQVCNLSNALAKLHGTDTINADDFCIDTDANGQTSVAVLARTPNAKSNQMYLCNDLDKLLDASSLEQATAMWQSVPFNAPGQPADAIDIANVYITSKEQQRTLFCGVRSNNQLLDNYCIDEAKNWSVLRTSTDFNKVLSQAVSHHAGYGRSGLFQLQAQGNDRHIQFTYKANRGTPTRDITTPKGANELASVSLNDQGTDTRLFVAAAEGIYMIHLGGEKDNQPIKIVEGNFRSVATHISQQQITLFALGDNGDGIYCSADIKACNTPADWHCSIPVIRKVNQMAFFTDAKQGNISLFATQQQGDLSLAQQNAQTSQWLFEQMQLPSESVDNVIEYYSHASRITVYDSKGDPVQPMSEVEVTVAVACRAKVNNNFYQFTPGQAVKIATDFTSSLNIDQSTVNLDANAILVSHPDADQACLVAPTQDLLSKLDDVKTGADLAKVQLEDEKGDKRPLVEPHFSPATLDSVAQSIQKFVELANKMPQDGSKLSPDAAATLPPQNFGIAVNGRTITPCAKPTTAPRRKVPSGDFFSNVVDTVIDIGSFVIEVVGGVITAVVEIAGKVLEFVIECIADILRAIGWLLYQIGVAIVKFIQWLGFIFNWGDILITKNALKAITLTNMRMLANSIDALKTSAQHGFEQFEQALGIRGQHSELQQAMSQLPQSPQISDLPANSPQAHYALTHFLNGLPSAHLESDVSLKIDEKVAPFMQYLEQLERNEADAIEQFYQQLKGLAVDNLASNNIGDFFAQLLESLTTDIVRLAKEVVLLALDIAKVVFESVIDLLDSKIYIPVLSWLYKQLTGSDLSIMDLLCLVSAVPATILCKIISGSAPFTQDFVEQASRLPTANQPLQQINRPALVSNRPDDVTEEEDKAVRRIICACHIAGAYGTMASVGMDIGSALSNAAADPFGWTESWPYKLGAVVAVGVSVLPTAYEVLSGAFADQPHLVGSNSSNTNNQHTTSNKPIRYFHTYWITPVPEWSSSFNFMCVLGNVVSKVCPRMITCMIGPMSAAARLVPVGVKITAEYNSEDRNGVLIGIDAFGEITDKACIISGFGDFYTKIPPLFKIKGGLLAATFVSKLAQGGARLVVERI